MRITFDFAKQQVGIEGDGPELVEVLGIVREIAPKLPSINIIASQVNGSRDTRADNGFRLENQGSSATQTLRQFVRSLPLNNIYEKIAGISYYQNKLNRVSAFSPKELGEWFTQCGFQKPSHMPVALSDARRRYGYMESVGRGMWRLTTNGENLIIGKIEQGPAGQED
jgi:hypothetical protein